MSDKKTIPNWSVDASMLYDRLKKAAIGETVTYADLSAIIGRNVQGSARHLVYSAINKALREDHMVFEAVMGVGYRRLDDVEIVNCSDNAFVRVRRMARRQSAKLTSVSNFAALPNELKIKHNTNISMLGALTHLIRPASVKRLESHVMEAATVLPSAKVLEHVKG